MRSLTAFAISLCSLILVPAFAQQPVTGKTLSTTCTFADGKQIRVAYAPPVAHEKLPLPKDKIWTPGNVPMDIFTEAGVSLEGKQLPPGAYTMYVIPGSGKWTLVVNKDVTPGSKYDETQDLVRAAMQMGQLEQSQELQIAFAQMGPKQCNIRIYYGAVGTWADFNEQ